LAINSILFHIEFDHSLENEIVNYSHRLAMRKRAIASYRQLSHCNLPSSPINKQQHIESYLQTSVYDDNKSPVTPLTNKFLWNKSISKDG
jgi:hypothetical protein